MAPSPPDPQKPGVKVPTPPPAAPITVTETLDTPAGTVNDD